MTETFIDKDIELPSLFEYYKYTFKCYFLNNSIIPLHKFGNTYSNVNLSKLQQFDDVDFLINNNTKLLQLTQPTLGSNHPAAKVALNKPFVINTDADLGSHSITSLFVKNTYPLLSSIIQNDQFLDSIVTLTLLNQYDNPHFIKLLRASPISKDQSQYSSLQILKKCKLFDSIPDFKFQETLLFKYFFQSYFIKNLFFRKSLCQFDSRILSTLEYIEQLPKELQTQIIDSFFNSLNQKESFMIKSFIDSNYDNLVIPKYFQDKMENFSKNISVYANIDQLRQLSTLNNLGVNSTYTIICKNLSGNDIYAYYKKLFTKKDFPIAFNSNIRIPYTFQDINISFNVVFGKTTRIDFTLNNKNLTDDLKASLLPYLETNLMLLFDDFIVAAYKHILEEKDKTFFFGHQNNAILFNIINSFFNEYRSKSLNAEIDVIDQNKGGANTITHKKVKL